MIEQGIVALLLATPAVTALIGTRIYPIKLPDGAGGSSMPPALTYQNISSPGPEFTLGKQLVDFQRIQFNAFAGEEFSGGYGACRSVLVAVDSVLNGFVGKLSDGTRVLFAKRQNDIDNFEDNARTYRCISEYEFETSIR